MDRLTLLRMRGSAAEEDHEAPTIVARAISSLPAPAPHEAMRPMLPPGLEGAIKDDAEAKSTTSAEGLPTELDLESSSSSPQDITADKEGETAASDGADAELKVDALVESAIAKAADKAYAGLGPVPPLKDLAGVWSDSLGNTIYVSPFSPIVHLQGASGRIKQVFLAADITGRLWCGNGALMHVGVAEQPSAKGWGVPIHLAWNTKDFKISTWDRISGPPKMPRPSAGNGFTAKKPAKEKAAAKKPAKYPDFAETIRAAPTPQGRKQKRLEQA
jgi:hypothetical protein